MPSLHAGYEYDVFISYRQNDNRSGWVSTLIESLREEMGSILKDPVNVYFDENPHDGLLDTHHVDKSLEEKLKCLVFIPILSRTYCDPKCFAWNHEFLPFRNKAKNDPFGLHVRLENRNVASRILPVQIHDLERKDIALFEKESEGPLRSIDFTFRSQGVNRPLLPDDDRGENLGKTVYRDQINKLANAIAEVVQTMATEPSITSEPPTQKVAPVQNVIQADRISGKWIMKELLRRNVPRAAITYAVVGWVLHQMASITFPLLDIGEKLVGAIDWFLIIGFPVAMFLAWFYEISPDGMIRTTSEKSITNPYKPSQKKPFTGPGVITILLMLLVAQYYYFNYVRDGAQGDVMEKSIAVLPFENQSEDKRDAYFAEGLTYDIINRLYIIRELSVISPTSSQTYTGTDKSIGTIASELKVGTILTGSVRRVGELVKISVQLRDGSNDQYLWGSSYEQKASEVQAIQSEIARQVAGVLKIKLNELEKAKLAKKPTENHSAYDYYIKGRSLYYQYNADSNDLAIEQFKMAIALDPQYSLAWAGLGDAYSQLHARFARGLQWIDSSIVAGSKAVKLDTNSSDAYKTLASAYSYARRYDTAFVLVKKAVEKNPTNAQAVGNLASGYFLRGEYLEALKLHKRAAGLNPRNAFPFQLAGWIYRLLGDLGLAESWLKTSLDLNPTYWDTYRELAFTYSSQGKNDAALELIPRMFSSIKREARALDVAGRIAHFAGDRALAKAYFEESIDKNPSYQNDPNSMSAIGLGQLYLDNGEKVQAEIYLTHALDLNMAQIQKGSQDDDPPFNIAAIYAIQGKKTQSLQWLQTAIDKNWTDHAQVEFGPYFALYRTDPDFQEKVNTVRKRMSSMLAMVD